MVTMRAARDEAFREAGIPPDGGDSEPWVDFKLGPLPMPFPNTDARRRTVKLHDLHHVLTGYRTDILGEFEISAWELAAGCGRFGVAWYLNLMGLTAGLVSAPGRTLRAFARGRHSDTLYTALSFDEVLDQPVDEVRARLRVLAGPGTPTPSDVLRFGLAALAGAALGLVTFTIALSPVMLAAWVLSYGAYRRQLKHRAA
ncbi:MAG: hypothetical protein IAE78_04880 [Myxococcus sp.]|nr:hypothetical protein [Myxococcus sp.]